MVSGVGGCMDNGHSCLVAVDVIAFQEEDPVTYSVLFQWIVTNKDQVKRSVLNKHNQGFHKLLLIVSWVLCTQRFFKNAPEVTYNVRLRAF